MKLETILQKLSNKEKAYINNLISTDELTGAKNRRAFNTEIELEIQRAERGNYDITLLMIDVDHFKKYNDTHGHTAGDTALKNVVSVIQSTARGYDSIYRIGGEEFAIILPNTTTDKGFRSAERIRQAVENQTDVTISVGVSNYKGTANNLHDFISYSDVALYQSKDTGRNKVSVYKKYK
jgi:diguanylate cyclase (GGDEF)-like protein